MQIKRITPATLSLLFTMFASGCAVNGPVNHLSKEGIDGAAFAKMVRVAAVNNNKAGLAVLMADYLRRVREGGEGLQVFEKAMDERFKELAGEKSGNPVIDGRFADLRSFKTYVDLSTHFKGGCIPYGRALGADGSDSAALTCPEYH